jgi:hypothetical protein
MNERFSPPERQGNLSFEGDTNFPMTEEGPEEPITIERIQELVKSHPKDLREPLDGQLTTFENLDDQKNIMFARWGMDKGKLRKYAVLLEDQQRIQEMLKPYSRPTELDQEIDEDEIIGTAPDGSPRYRTPKDAAYRGPFQS